MIGELSAGGSHNLNNILTSVLGPAQLLEMKTDDPNLLKDIHTIQISATRAADLVRRLSWTTVDRRQELEPVDLELTIGQAIEAASPKWRDEMEARGCRVEIHTRLDQTPEIRGTRAGLHDMLLNLIFNAVDAMPDGGQLKIETSFNGEYVCLSVADNGTGMSEATRSHVFEPFFTTKMDVGSGLGLSTLFGTLRGWGGSVDVQSKLGEGSEFQLRFSPCDGFIPETSSNDTPQARNVRGRVLVVDDDLFVREFLLAALRPVHNVQIVEDAKKGLARLDTEEFDVAILDLGIPGLTGDALARSIRERDRNVSLVLITGWDLDRNDPRREPFDLLLKKPFDSIHQIKQTIAEAILLRNQRAQSEHTDR